MKPKKKAISAYTKHAYIKMRNQLIIMIVEIHLWEIINLFAKVINTVNIMKKKEVLFLN